MGVPAADELAKSQADLNEYLAYMIMGEAFNERRYVDRALTALANHNLAAGFEAEFAAIETDVLKWWRGALGLPSYLTRSQMPQGGWTETVAAGRVDLAATVTRICNRAVQLDARPGRSQDGRLAC